MQMNGKRRVIKTGGNVDIPSLEQHSSGKKLSLLEETPKSRLWL